MQKIGKRVGLTAPAVAERIRKLEENGVIEGYHAHVDYDKLGLTLTALVEVQNRRADAANVIALAHKLPEVVACDTVTGQTNYLLRVVAGSRQQLSQVIDQFLDLGMTTSSIVLDRPVAFKPITRATCEPNRFGT